jgi:hypothetical protein
MGLMLKTFALGAIELSPTNTASNFTVVLPATTGQLSYADSSTGGMFLPVGTTAQRPATPTVGMLRYNTSTNGVEVYNGSTWS